MKMKKFTYLFALLLLCYTTALLAATQTINVNLTTSSPQFTRPNAGNPPSALSTQVGCYYSVFSFTAPVSGTYTMQAQGTLDNFGCLYQNSFIASQPLTNILRSNDDWDISNPSNKNYGITRTLTAGVTYYLVSTMFYANTVGNYDVIITGPFLTPLPVELNNFNAKAADQHVELNWSTITEHNCQGFDIERSTNGSSFTSIGYVGSGSNQGVSNSELAYGFNDEKPSAVNYYRLAQKDLDGKINYSAVIRVEYASTENQVQLFPNPCSTDLNITLYSSVDNEATISLMDYTGRMVWQETFNTIDGANVKHVSTESLTPGMYILTSSVNGQLNSTDKIFKK